MAFELEHGTGPGAEVPVTSDIQQRGLKVIRDTVGDISTFYRFSTTPGSAP